MTDETPELRDDERGRMDYDPERAKAVLNEVKRRVAEAPRLPSQIADDILQAEFLTARELEDLAAPRRGWSLIGPRGDAHVEGPRGFLMVLARTRRAAQARLASAWRRRSGHARASCAPRHSSRPARMSSRRCPCGTIPRRLAIGLSAPASTSPRPSSGSSSPPSYPALHRPGSTFRAIVDTRRLQALTNCPRSCVSHASNATIRAQFELSGIISSRVASQQPGWNSPRSGIRNRPWVFAIGVLQFVQIFVSSLSIFRRPLGCIPPASESTGLLEA